MVFEFKLTQIMRYSVLASIIIVLLTLGKTKKADCQIKGLDTLDVYEYCIEIKRIVYFSEDSYFPFTVSLRPFGYFSVNDIKYGHNDKQSEFEILWMPEEKEKSFIKGPKFTFEEDVIDTVYNFFQVNTFENCIKKSNEQNDSITFFTMLENSIDLRKTLEYSFLLTRAKVPVLSAINNNQVLRIAYPVGSYPFIEEFNIVRINIMDDSAKIFLTSIDVRNLQQIVSLKSDSAWLMKRDIKQLKKRIALINPNVKTNFCLGNNSIYNDCLVEYKNEINCFNIVLTNFNLLKLNCSKEVTDKFLGIENMLISFKRKYF